MKVAVIGGSGFLGTEVVKELLNNKYIVTILDKNEPLIFDKKINYIRADISDLEILERVIKNNKYIYNFAGVSDLDYGSSNPIKSVEQNVLSTVYMLNFCKKYKIKRFIYASTIYVYSDKGGFYRCSKQAAESYIEEYYKKYRVKFSILRFGSIYGPGAGKNNGLLKIISNSIKNRKIFYEGSPNTVREYIHVSDAAKASVDILSNKFANKSIILTGKQAIQMNDLLKMLSEILGYKKVIFKKINDLNHYEHTPYKYAPKLGIKYTPSTYIDFGQGILQLIDYLQKK